MHCTYNVALMHVCATTVAVEKQWVLHKLCGFCSLRNPTCNVRAPHCHLWPAPLNNIFPHYLINGAIFEKKKLLNIKCVFWVSLQILSEIFFILRRIKWDMIGMGEERGVYKVLVGKPEGMRPLGRPRRRWVDNIRMDLQEVGCGYMDWIGLAQDRDRWRTLVSAAMNLRVPWNAENFLTSCKPVSFSRRTLHHGVSK